MTLPAVPLRDNVVFPSQLAPLAAGRPRSVAALEAAVNGDGRVVLAIQRDAARDEASLDDVHTIAVIAHVGAFRRLPGGGAHALVEGKERVRIDAFDASGDAWIATVTPVTADVTEGTEVDALFGSVRTLFADYVNAGAQVGADTAVAMARAGDPELIADIASTCPDFDFDDRVALLQETDPIARLRSLIPLLAREVEVAQLRTKIHEDVQKTINNSQREHILREQLRAIRKELTELDDAGEDDEDLATRVEKAGHARERQDTRAQRGPSSRADPERQPRNGHGSHVGRLAVGSAVGRSAGGDPGHPARRDASSTRTTTASARSRTAFWNGWPFGIGFVLKDASESAGPVDAGTPLDRSLDARGGWRRGGQRRSQPGQATGHPRNAGRVRPGWRAARGPRDDRTRRTRAGEAKDVCKRRSSVSSGPQALERHRWVAAIARALDRKFVRMSLGGIRDEAEIRGHRRTYIGALPGRIIQSMRTAGTRNAVIMLDEIDKVGADFRGDPSAALLEVLDPEQNWEFSDHYLEVPYDLSQVLFITTANIAETISPPLRDRMEIIRITGYTEQEKVQIAERHLVPRQLDQHSLDAQRARDPPRDHRRDAARVHA